jgi:hypothetical protein
MLLTNIYFILTCVELVTDMQSHFICRKSVRVKVVSSDTGKQKWGF